jgi:hypothetical protein
MQSVGTSASYNKLDSRNINAGLRQNQNPRGLPLRFAGMTRGSVEKIEI